MFSMPASGVCGACMGLLLAGCLYHSTVIVFRMHKHMQMNSHYRNMTLASVDANVHQGQRHLLTNS